MDMGVPFLGRIPLDPDVVTQSDAGEPFAMFNSDTPTAEALSRDRQQGRSVLQEERVARERRAPAAPLMKEQTMKAKDATAGAHAARRSAEDCVGGHADAWAWKRFPSWMRLGRVLGEDIVAERDNPPWDNSAMDGFAVRWDDIKQEHAIQKPVTLDGDRRRAGRQDADEDPSARARRFAS